jgi:hypothetical protein
MIEKEKESFSNEEAALRRDEVIRRMANTSPHTRAGNATLPQALCDPRKMMRRGRLTAVRHLIGLSSAGQRRRAYYDAPCILSALHASSLPSDGVSPLSASSRVQPARPASLKSV